MSDRSQARESASIQATPASQPSAVLTTEGKSLQVSSSRVSLGQPVTLTGQGFPAGTIISWQWVSPAGMTAQTPLTYQAHEQLHQSSQSSFPKQGSVTLQQVGSQIQAQVIFETPGDYQFTLAQQGTTKGSITVSVGSN